MYANFNNATASLPGGDDGRTTKKDNHYQLLLSESTDGGKSFGQPVKVADYYELPDCATYQNGQDAGRACVPEKGPTANSIFRATNIPTGVVNPNDPSDVAVVFGSYINRDSQGVERLHADRVRRHRQPDVRRREGHRRLQQRHRDQHVVRRRPVLQRRRRERAEAARS